MSAVLTAFLLLIPVAAGGGPAAPPAKKAPKPAVKAVSAPPAVTLPETIRRTLDHEYPGWKLARAATEIEQQFAKLKPPRHPSLDAADFNGDGRLDYVLQIVLMQPEQEEQILLGFVTDESAYKELILESRGPDPTVYIWVGKKPVPETGADGQEKRVLKPVLTVLGGPLGDSLYVFEENAFREIQLSEDASGGSDIPRIDSGSL